MMIQSFNKAKVSPILCWILRIHWLGHYSMFDLFIFDSERLMQMKNRNSFDRMKLMMMMMIQSNFTTFYHIVVIFRVIFSVNFLASGWYQVSVLNDSKRTWFSLNFSVQFKIQTYFNLFWELNFLLYFISLISSLKLGTL